MIFAGSVRHCGKRSGRRYLPSFQISFHSIKQAWVPGRYSIDDKEHSVQPGNINRLLTMLFQIEFFLSRWRTVLRWILLRHFDGVWRMHAWYYLICSAVITVMVATDAETGEKTCESSDAEEQHCVGRSVRASVDAASMTTINVLCAVMVSYVNDFERTRAKAGKYPS